METYLLLSLLFMYLLFKSLHYSYLRNLFAQTLKAGLSLSLSVCISFYHPPEPTCDVEKFMGGPNAPASHAFIKDRLIPSRVASNSFTWRIFHWLIRTSSSMLQPARAHCVYMLIQRINNHISATRSSPEWVHRGSIYSKKRKKEKKKKHTRWCHSAVPASFIGNVEFFSATTLTRGIFSALISTADKQDVHGWYVEMTARSVFFCWI